MVYVIRAEAQLIVTNQGPYWKITDMRFNGNWNLCRWSKLRDATIFSTREEAEAAIKVAGDFWVKCVSPKIISIHPLNITCT